MEDDQLPGQVGDALDSDDGDSNHRESDQFNLGSRSHEASKILGSSGAPDIPSMSSYQRDPLEAGAPGATSRSFAAFRPADAFVDILMTRPYRSNRTRNSLSSECARVQ